MPGRIGGVCPRCDVCGRVVRVRGVGIKEVWCANCLAVVFPFNGIVSEGEFKGALKEYREGLGSRVVDFEGSRFNPFGDEEGDLLKELDITLKGC